MTKTRRARPPRGAHARGGFRLGTRTGVAALSALLALATCDSPTDYRVDVPGPFGAFPVGVEFVVPNPPEWTADAGSDGVRILNLDADGASLLRFDTDGDNLDAHEGEIERFGDRYYFYGGSYDCGFHLGQGGSPFCGFKVYSSPDLISWTDRGYLFDGSTDVWQRRCNGSQFGCYRPHVAFNRRTGRYVLWINTYELRVGSPGSAAGSLIAAAHRTGRPSCAPS